MNIDDPLTRPLKKNKSLGEESNTTGAIGSDHVIILYIYIYIIAPPILSLIQCH